MILVENGVITRINGRTIIEQPNNDLIKVNPNIQEAHQLRAWYDIVYGDNEKFIEN